MDLPELVIGEGAEGLVRRTILPSGVRVLSEHVPGVRSATVGFWLAVGSRDELGAEGGSPSHFGSTHFLEHLLFKGTPRRSALDIAVAFDAVGGEHNAITAKEYTCYYAKVRDRDLLMAVDVLADMVGASTIDRDEFETERGVILEELAMAEDDPGDVAGERLFEAVLGDHPLGRPIGGTPATIRAVTRDAVWEHYRATYSPHDLVVAAAGAVDHDVLVQRVAESLEGAGWDLSTPHAPAARRSTALAPLLPGRPVTVVRKPTEQVSVMLGMPGLVATDDRRTALSVLSSVLGGGMSSRLFQEVRERRGLAYSVYSYAQGYSDAGLFTLYAGCAPGKERSVADIMLGELRRIAADGITPDELVRARGQLSGAAALALEDSDTRMSRLGRSELSTGEFVDLDEQVRRLDAVGLDDVRALAAMLAESPVSVSAVGPVDESVFDDVAVPR